MQTILWNMTSRILSELESEETDVTGQKIVDICGRNEEDCRQIAEQIIFAIVNESSVKQRALLLFLCRQRRKGPEVRLLRWNLIECLQNLHDSKPAASCTGLQQAIDALIDGGVLPAWIKDRSDGAGFAQDVGHCGKRRQTQPLDRDE